MALDRPNSEAISRLINARSAYSPRLENSMSSYERGTVGLG